MNDFREIYQQSMQNLPGYIPDVSSVLDEGRHRKIAGRQKKQMFSAAVAACSLLLACGFGAAVAARYFCQPYGSTGIQLTGGEDRAAGQAEQPVPENAPEKRMLMQAPAAASEGKGLQAMPDAGEADDMARGAVETAQQENARGAAETAQQENARGAVETAQQENAPEAAKYGVEEMAGDAAAPGKAEEGFREYGSIEELRENENATIALPEIPEGEIEEVIIRSSVTAEDVTFRQSMKDGRQVQVRAAAGRDMEGQGEAPAVPQYDEGAEEYTTKAGYTYTIMETGTEKSADYEIHAEIHAGAYEIAADFRGYTQDEAFRMIESMDLGIY